MARPTPGTIRLHASTPAPSWEGGGEALSSDELASILTAVPALILLVDLENRVLACTGGSRMEIPQGADLFDFVPARHRAFYEEQFRRTCEGYETVVFDVEGPGFEWVAPDRPRRGAAGHGFA